MSNELERSFAALSSDADQAQLTPAPALRRRGDRQTVARAVAGVAAVAVLVTGVTVGARVVLAGPDRDEPPPVPAASPTPRRTPSIAEPSPAPSTPRPANPRSSAPPSTESTSKAPPRIPTSIPARAFLRASDAPGEGATPERLGAGDHALPDFCGNDYARRDELGIRATQLMLYKSADSPPDSTPKSALYEDVMVFRDNGAEGFMDDLRAAVKNCRTDGDHQNVSLGGIGAGDESLLVERNNPARTDEGSPVGDGSLHRVHFSAVRVGDTVAFLSDTGWESGSADRTDTTHLTGRAADRLTNWRS